jgi:exosortase E/protease (VPEID-CTERM system)
MSAPSSRPTVITEASRRRSSPSHGFRPAWRAAGLALLLVLEWAPVSAMVSTGRGGQSFARALAAFLCCFLVLTFFKLRRVFSSIADATAPKAIEWRYLAGHLLLMLLFLRLSATPPMRAAAPAAFLGGAWFLSGLGGIALAAVAFIPPSFWWAIMRRAGSIWVASSVAAAASWSFIHPLWSVWDESKWRWIIDATLDLSYLILRPLLRDVFANHASLILGTTRFSVRIGGACSGFEGAGLMFAFSLAWLWLLRRELKFPHALLLIPGSIAVMWLLNGVRIAALILIGNAGAPEIAMGGFHSQAGWISFNLVAVGVMIAAGRVEWWRAAERDQRVTILNGNAAAPFVSPFMAILAAGMIARAASSGFEWIYPLRVFAAGAVLWHFRPAYRKLDWRCTWFAPIAGILVFALWMWLEPTHRAHDGDMPPALAAAPAIVSGAWILFRVLGAVIAVPIAEELAFRAYPMVLSTRSSRLAAFSIASLGFGLLHGDRWIAGTIAGLIYALALLRRSKVGDAVLAHAITNLLIAATVLIGSKWYLW